MWCTLRGLHTEKTHAHTPGRALSIDPMNLPACDTLPFVPFPCLWGRWSCHLCLQGSSLCQFCLTTLYVTCSLYLEAPAQLPNTATSLHTDDDPGPVSHTKSSRVNRAIASIGRGETLPLTASRRQVPRLPPVLGPCHQQGFLTHYMSSGTRAFRRCPSLLIHVNSGRHPEGPHVPCCNISSLRHHRCVIET